MEESSSFIVLRLDNKDNRGKIWGCDNDWYEDYRFQGSKAIVL
jgi:hypothetical protein